jgi:glycosyltransferase involved in cell wall biosynthesis
MCYPDANQRDKGIFVHRRAMAVARQAGVELSVVSPQPYVPLLRPKRQTCSADTALQADYPPMLSIPVLSWITDGQVYSRVLQQAIKARQQKFDLIDAHFAYPDGVGAWHAARRTGLPVAVTLRGKLVRMSRCIVQRRQIARMLRDVDVLFSVSQSLATLACEVAETSLRTHVIPNGIDSRCFHAMDRQEARSTLGWDADAKYVLAVGHLQRIKGFDRIVRAVEAAAQQVGQIHLILAGSERGERDFKRELWMLINRVNERTRSGSQPLVHFVGPTEPTILNRMYNAADLFVNASHLEGWCNAISEALAVGTPVVATDVGGNAEQITDARFGYVVPDGDESALCQAICRSLDQRWDHAGIAEAKGQRSWDDVGCEVLGILEDELTWPRRNTSINAAHRAPVCQLNRPDTKAIGQGELAS